MMELYQYMVEKRDELYATKGTAVEIDMHRFFQLYKLTCDMIQVRNMVNQEEDLDKILQNVMRDRRDQDEKQGV